MNRWPGGLSAAARTEHTNATASQNAGTDVSNRPLPRPTGITSLDRETDVDVIIVARGGGSLEDLRAFNEEIVARAVGKAKKPVVSAVGHEVDFTICDFVADVRAPTPSAAAELVVRDKTDLLNQVENLKNRLINAMYMILRRRADQWSRVYAHLKDPRRRLVEFRLRGDDLMVRLQGSLQRILDQKVTRVRTAERNLFYRTPVSRVDRCRDLLWQRAEKLQNAINEYLGRQRRCLERSMDRLDAMNPLSILRRGYSVVRRIPSMEIVRSSRSVKKGDKLDVKLHQGQLICDVEKTRGNG